MAPTISFAAAAITPSKPTNSVYTRPEKKAKMSITQTYFLAHSARGKLSKEASRADHDLRLLVGHANMLDSLMLDLANAEQEQERWFNSTVTDSVPEEEEEEEEATSPAETTVEESEPEWEVAEAEVSEDSDDDDDEELALTRTQSHHSPPELTMEMESDSEDESMPSSPEDSTVNVLSEKQRQAIATTSFYDSRTPTISTTATDSLEEDGYFLPSRSQPIAIAAY